jgi:hypothetical protein
MAIVHFRHLKTKQAIWPVLLIILSQLKNISDAISHWQNIQWVLEHVKKFAMHGNVQLAMFFGGLAWLAVLALWPSSKGPPAHKLMIRSAVYGTGPVNDMDVTEILQNHMRDALAVVITNDLFGHDPAPNIVKRLRVDYSYGNQAVLTVTRPENTRLVLPEDSWLQAETQRLTDELGAVRDAPKEDALPRLVAVDLPTRLFAMCRELQAFLEELGPERDVTWRSDMGINKFNEENKDIQIRERKMEAMFYRRFHQRVVDIYNEACESGKIHDGELEGILRVRIDHNAAVKKIIERLALLSAEVVIKQ